ncbi:hypothetical protein [Polyangium sp. 6x1]|uniref:hypothetical protein n=1 Tax=Polyangium sp. 6x1 TaxID=3042689 RepID=UPI002482F687|nr:hypothetical protein [Polyangium sp. 6x1]MDI1444340.1 hypothetical protein [Polyangium sp. 6x1]
MNSNQNTLSLTALALAVSFAAACSSEVGGSSTSSSSSSSSSSGGGVMHNDLFACGVMPDCEQISIHISPEPEWALVCSAKLIVSQQPGVLSALENPGPVISQTERIIIVQGDGKALVQSRHRECGTDSCWEPSSAHQICDLVLGNNVAAGCAAMDDMTCRWSPWGPGGLENCMDVDDWSCDDVAAVLQPK